MTDTERVILDKLASIEQRLDLLTGPLVAEQARQLRAASHETVLAHNKMVRARAKSRAPLVGGGR